MNYSETYFELDSEEATHCDHCHLIYIKGHVDTVDTKDQNNAIWMLGCQLSHTCLSLIAILGPNLICQGAVLLVSLLHSHQKDWFRHDRLSILNVICMSTLSIWAKKKHVLSQSDLRANWPWNWKKSPQSE